MNLQLGLGNILDVPVKNIWPVLGVILLVLAVSSSRDSLNN